MKGTAESGDESGSRIIRSASGVEPLPESLAREAKEPAWVISAKMESFSGDVELDTHRQEKVWFRAGFTCLNCEWPYRPFPMCICEGEGLSECRQRSSTMPAAGCGHPLKYTLRCRECNSRMKRWCRSKKYENRILTVNSILPESFVAFVTLTIPNVKKEGKTLATEARLLKKKVADFRRRSEFGKHCLGGIDVVESTESESEWNIHHHGIWIMEKSWKQKKLQETWGEGIVHIQKVRKPHAVLRYLTAYAAKDPIKGVRCLETFGAVRGGAWSAIEEYAAQAKSSPENADVA